MRCLFVQPGVVCGGAEGALVPVEHCQGVAFVGMVEHYIQDDSNAPCMAFIHKSTKRFRRSVIFVQSIMIGRVVAPAIIAIKLINGHQFDSVDAEFVKIIQQCREAGVIHR